MTRRDRRHRAEPAQELLRREPLHGEGRDPRGARGAARRRPATEAKSDGEKHAAIEAYDTSNTINTELQKQLMEDRSEGDRARRRARRRRSRSRSACGAPAADDPTRGQAHEITALWAQIRDWRREAHMPLDPRARCSSSSRRRTPVQRGPSACAPTATRSRRPATTSATSPTRSATTPRRSAGSPTSSARTTRARRTSARARRRRVARRSSAAATAAEAAREEAARRRVVVPGDRRVRGVAQGRDGPDAGAAAGCSRRRRAGDRAEDARGEAREDHGTVEADLGQQQSNVPSAATPMSAGSQTCTDVCTMSRRSARTPRRSASSPRSSAR